MNCLYCEQPWLWGSMLPCDECPVYHQILLAAWAVQHGKEPEHV